MNLSDSKISYEISNYDVSEDDYVKKYSNLFVDLAKVYVKFFNAGEIAFIDDRIVLRKCHFLQNCYGVKAGKYDQITVKLSINFETLSGKIVAQI